MEFRSSPDLERLLERCRQGDEQAWSILLDRYGGYVYGVARKAGLDAEDCKDVYISTFASLHRSLSEIRAVRALSSWLAQTAYRESQRIRRASSRYDSAVDLDLNLDELVRAEDASAEEEVLRAEKFTKLIEVLNGMESKCRNLLKALYLSEDVSYADLATSLGLPIGSIGPTRARCIEKLRKLLHHDGFFDE